MNVGNSSNQTPLVFRYSFNYVFIEYLFCVRHILQQESANLSPMDKPDLLSVLANRVLFGT